MVQIFCTLRVDKCPAEINRKKNWMTQYHLMLQVPKQQWYNERDTNAKYQTLTTTICEKQFPPPGKTKHGLLWTWRDGPLGRSGWGGNRGVGDGLLVHSPEAGNTNGQGWWRSKRNTKRLVLTAPELGGVVKVGEERVKLVRTEERVTAGLQATGNSYARDDGSLDILKGKRV